MCCADTEARLYSSVLAESLGPSHRKGRQPGHQESRTSGESAVAVLGIKVMTPLTPRLECVCVCFGSECAGPCREFNGAGFPPGPSPRGASHRQTHPVWSSAGLPRPRPHHRRVAQLQRPLLHTPGMAPWWKLSIRTHTRELIPAACFSQGKEKMADMRRKVLSRNSKSDHLTIINAFQVLQPSSAPFLSQLPSVWIDPVLTDRCFLG